MLAQSSGLDFQKVQTCDGFRDLESPETESEPEIVKLVARNFPMDTFVLVIDIYVNDLMAILDKTVPTSETASVSKKLQRPMIGPVKASWPGWRLRHRRLIQSRR